MRRYGGTLGLLGLAALLGLYFAFVEAPRERAKLEQQDRAGRVLVLTEDEVTKVEVDTQADRFVLERTDSGKWRVLEPVVGEADEGTVRRLLTQLASLSVVRAINDVEDFAALGLERPEVRVAVHRTGGRSAVWFGDENPVGSGVYVQRDDHEVFLVAASSKATFQLSRDDVRRKEFVEFRPEVVTEIAVVDRGRSLRLRRDESEWRIEDPPLTADPETVLSLLGRLRALRAAGFVDTADERAALKLPTAPRTQVTLMAGDQVVRIAFHQGADGALYARASGETLYRVNESVIAALPLDAPALRDRRLVRMGFESVRIVDVERGPEHYTVERRDESWAINGRLLAPEAASEVDAMVRVFVGLRGETVAAETLDALPPQTVAAPASRVTLRGADGAVLGTVTIGEGPGEERYAYSESSGPVFLVAASIVDRIPSKSSLETQTATTP